MSKHVDLYSAFAMAPTYEFIKARPPENVARAGRDELPYWNGYTYYTEVHEESECELYAPKDEDGNHLSPRFKNKDLYLAISLLIEINDGNYDFIYDTYQERSECRECGVSSPEGSRLPEHKPDCLWVRVKTFLESRK